MTKVLHLPSHLVSPGLFRCFPFPPTTLGLQGPGPLVLGHVSVNADGWHSVVLHQVVGKDLTGT